MGQNTGMLKNSKNVQNIATMTAFVAPSLLHIKTICNSLHTIQNHTTDSKLFVKVKPDEEHSCVNIH